MTEIHWRQDATLDLREIRQHIAGDNPTAADRVIESIIEATLRLADFPESGPRRQDIASSARMIVIGSYLVLYAFVENRVFIVRIVHGSRDLGQFSADFAALQAGE